MPAHERIEREAGHQRSIALAKDSDRGVDRLHVISRTDIAVGVGRPSIAVVVEVETVKASCTAAAARRRCRCRWSSALHGLVSETHWRQHTLFAAIRAMLMLRGQAAWKPPNIAVEGTALMQLHDDRQRHGVGDALPVARCG